MDINKLLFRDMKRKKVRLNGHIITVLKPTKTTSYEEGMSRMKAIVRDLKED